MVTIKILPKYFTKVEATKAFFAVGTYSIELFNGQMHKSRISFLAIPFKGNFISIVLVDTDEDNNSKILNEVASSVRFKD